MFRTALALLATVCGVKSVKADCYDVWTQQDGEINIIGEGNTTYYPYKGVTFTSNNTDHEIFEVSFTIMANNSYCPPSFIVQEAPLLLSTMCTAFNITAEQFTTAIQNVSFNPIHLIDDYYFAMGPGGNTVGAAYPPTQACVNYFNITGSVNPFPSFPTPSFIMTSFNYSEESQAKNQMALVLKELQPNKTEALFTHEPA